MTELKAAETGAQFLTQVFDDLRCEATISIHENGSSVRYRIDGEAEKLSTKADLISALSLLTGRVVSQNGERLDCLLDFGGRFEARAKTITRAAKDLGQIASDANRRIYFSDLTSAERKLMHHALVDTDAVTTRSDGRQTRRLIIEPTDQSES